MFASLQRAVWLFALFVGLASSTSPVQCRIWSRNPVNLAQDYGLILDNRGNGEIVFIIWVSPPMLPSTSSETLEILDKYVLIGVVHVHSTKEGAKFDRIGTLEVRDGDGQPLKTQATDALPPTVVGVFATMQSAFARSIGAVGQGTQWFVFEGGTVHACAKGSLSVLFADEEYTYNTPIPGCP